MEGLRFRSITFMLVIAFLVWSSSLEMCNARRGKHWRHSRETSASLLKKKTKSHGRSHHNHHGGSKSPKAPSHKTPSLPPSPEPVEATPPLPPQKGYKGGRSATFNVLDFGAKGDGSTDDTKVKLEAQLFALALLFVGLVRKVNTMKVFKCMLMPIKTVNLV